jgi:hypothetical protein
VSVDFKDALSCFMNSQSNYNGNILEIRGNSRNMRGHPQEKKENVITELLLLLFLVIKNFNTCNDGE